MSVEAPSGDEIPIPGIRGADELDLALLGGRFRIGTKATARGN